MESKELPTAEEFLFKKGYKNDQGIHFLNTALNMHEYAVLFAKWHREQQAEAIRTKVKEILKGIDSEYSDDPEGWWTNSSEVKFGQEKLNEIEGSILNAYKEDNIQ